MILVTGGSGFVGTHLLRKLLARGEKVRALYRNRKPERLCKEEMDRIEWVHGDITDFQSLEDALPGVENVFHCAATVSFDSRDREKMMAVNADGTSNLVNACLHYGKISKLVHLSSVAALGRADPGSKIHEETEWINHSNNTHYSISKYEAEMEVWRGMAEGLNAVILNPTIILGEGNWKESSNLIFRYVYDEYPFYPSGTNGYVDVQDVAEALILLMDSPIENERFVFCENNYRYKEIMDYMAESFQKKEPHIEVKKWMSELAWRYYALKKVIGQNNPLITKESARTGLLKIQYDNAKWKRFFPAFEFTPIKDCIQRSCSFYLTNV